MDPLVASSLIGMGGTGLGASTNLLNYGLQKRLLSQQRKENFEYNEKAAENADKRQRAQYNDLYSPKALLGQYAAAGLSPSMMMSGGAPAVGQSSAQGNMSASLSGPYPSFQPIDPVAMAQIRNLDALTEKTKAETTNINADTEFTFANILKAAAETDNLKLENGILKLERDKKELDLLVQKETSDEVIKQAEQKSLIMFEQCEKLRNENKSIKLQNQFTEETFATRVKQLTAEYKNTLSQSALNWANVNLSEAQIDSLAEHVAIAHFNSRTERLATNAQIQQFQKQVEQWAKQNGFTEQQLKQDKTKNWLDFAAKIFGSICFVGGSVGGAVIKARQ